ncbi:MAG: porin family protein [Sphingomonas sp.]|uniref:outer membrane protein n=1 Tax=Sphingomonas sp. TaxID=28214 RepID=UPI001AC91E6B|nr:porin family protein [Sphingomonas sp.]MBN8809177.1 porin family protein [Sphingomonas sp.]
MRQFVFAAASAAALVTAAPAFAQDGPPPSDATFTGFRAGAILGYDRLQPGKVPNSSIDDSNSADGLTYGGDVGYDISSNRWVFGVEGEVTGSTSKVTNNPSAAGALGYGRVKAGRDIYGGVRAGYRVAPATLIYVKGGYTNQRLDLVASNGTTETGQHFNLDGWRAGIGLEQSIGTNTYAKIEYRYSNYGQARLEYANGSNTNNFSVDTDRHQAVVGVGFRF